MTFVGSWPDHRDVVRHIAESTPDVVLMDIDMPHVDGVQGVTLLRKQFKDLNLPATDLYLPPHEGIRSRR